MFCEWWLIVITFYFKLLQYFIVFLVPRHKIDVSKLHNSHFYYYYIYVTIKTNGCAYMKLTTDEVEILNFFCFRLLHDFNNSTYNMPYLKFIFNDSDYKEIITYLENLKVQKKAIRLNIKTHLSNRTVSLMEIEETIKLMEEIRNRFIHNRCENHIYIEIPDYKKFFELLNELMIEFDQKSHFNNFHATALLRTIWLRMSPSDIFDVNTFLKRQISFTKNDYLISDNETELKQVEDLSISYLNHGNKAFFETNRHIRPFIRREVEKMSDDIFDFISIYKYYPLPVIHCAFIKEDEEPTCYIYGIQHLQETVKDKDEVINERIREEKKRLRNKMVSADFIIALKIFIDILKEKKITTIKVPLLQVFNYDFHQKMSEEYRDKMASYSKEAMEDLEATNTSNYDITEYENTKEQYERFANKEDTISKNKTERLLSTFYLVAENYGDLEIITEPFMESDYLICKINYQKEKRSRL